MIRIQLDRIWTLDRKKIIDLEASRVGVKNIDAPPPVLPSSGCTDTYGDIDCSNSVVILFWGVGIIMIKSKIKYARVCVVYNIIIHIMLRIAWKYL